MGFRCARLRAEFEGFVAGNSLVVCWTPFKGRAHHQVGRLSPVEHGVWDLRSVDPRPGLAGLLLPRRSGTSCVALTCSPRSVDVDWLARAPLGPRGETASGNARSGNMSIMWNELFPAKILSSERKSMNVSRTLKQFSFAFDEAGTIKGTESAYFGQRLRNRVDGRSVRALYRSPKARLSPKPNSPAALVVRRKWCTAGLPRRAI